MEFQIDNFMKKFMGVLVAIIVVMVVLIPITSEMAHHSETKNTGVNDVANTTRMSLVDDAILIYGTDAGEVSISTGDREYTYDATQNMLVCYFHSDTCWLEEDRVHESSIPIISFIAGTNNINLNSYNWSLVYDGNTIKVTYGPNDLVVEVPAGEYNYVYDPEGNYNYTSYQAVGQVKINDDAETISLIMRGWWGTSYNTMPFTKLDIENGVEAISVSQTNPAIVTDGHLFLTITDNEDGTYSIGPTATFVNDETGATASVSNLGVIAPREYTYYTENSASTILGVIPVFVLLGIVLAITRTFMPGSKDKSSVR